MQVIRTSYGGILGNRAGWRVIGQLIGSVPRVLTSASFAITKHLQVLG